MIDDRAVIERTILPIELMKEYEKLAHLFEERTYIQNVNPTGLFELKINAVQLFLRETNGIFIEEVNVHQQVDSKITESCTATVGGMVCADSSGYSSVAQAQFKQQLRNKNWVKIGTAFGFPTSLGLDFCHHLSNRFYIISNNFLQVHSGCFVASVNCQLSCKIDDQSTLVYKVKNNADLLGMEISRKLSDNVRLSVELAMTNDSSYAGLLGLFKLNEDYLLNGAMKLSSTGFSVSYGVDHKFSTLTNLRAMISVSSSGVNLHLRLIRTTMSFVFTFILSNSLSFHAIAFGTFFPALVFCLMKVIQSALHFHNHEIYVRDEYARELLQKKKEAELAVDLMRETSKKVSTIEKARQGLVIVEAWFGCLFSTCRFDPLSASKVINVTIPLQAAVQDSKLILCSSSKTSIPGFYDPCFGENKHLRVQYEFRGDMHEVTIENSEPLFIPRHSHKIVH